MAMENLFMKQALMIKQLLILIIFAFSLIQPASGQTSYGNADCGTWLTNKKEERVWLAGYMSGLFMMDSIKEGISLTNYPTTYQIFLWMDNHCKSNPLSTLLEGGTALYLEVLRKQ